MVKTIGLADIKGVFVTEVTTGGAAEQAGLQKGDVILAIDGEDVNIGWRDVLENLYAPSAGDEVNLLIFRDKRKKMMQVKLGTKKPSFLKKRSNTIRSQRFSTRIRAANTQPRLI